MATAGGPTKLAILSLQFILSDFMLSQFSVARPGRSAAVRAFVRFCFPAAGTSRWQAAARHR